MPDDLPLRKPSPPRSRWDLPIALLLCAASAAFAYALASRGKAEPPQKTIVESEVDAPAPPPPAPAPLARIENACAVQGRHTVRVRFTAPVDKALAEIAANYTIRPDIKIEAASLGDDGRTVTLTTSELKHGVEYRLVVGNVAEAFVTLKETRASFRYEGTDRVRDGLVALYTFDEGEGDVIRDVSHVGEPLDLRLAVRGKSAWVPGALELKEKRYIASDGFADKIIDACRVSKAVSIELWMTPAKAAQYGSPEIVLIGWRKKDRNLSLAQEGPGIIVKLRTTKSSNEGETFQVKKCLDGKLAHVVFTRDANGNATLYVNGHSVHAQAMQGDFSNWSRGYRLLTCPDDEYKKTWDGQMHLMAIYARALTEDEVKKHHALGPDGKGTEAEKEPTP